MLGLSKGSPLYQDFVLKEVNVKPSHDESQGEELEDSEKMFGTGQSQAGEEEGGAASCSIYLPASP